MLLKTCDRCDETFEPNEEQIFSISYKTLGEVSEGYKPWVTLSLCRECQSDLRTELYMRGLIKRF